MRAISSPLFICLEGEQTGRVIFFEKLLPKFCKRNLSLWSHQSEQPHSLLLGQSESRRETGSRRLRQREKKSCMESKIVLARSLARALVRSLASSWPLSLHLFFFLFPSSPSPPSFSLSLLLSCHSFALLQGSLNVVGGNERARKERKKKKKRG